MFDIVPLFGSFFYNDFRLCLNICPDKKPQKLKTNIGPE